MLRTVGMIAASATLVWTGGAASEIEHVSPAPEPLKVGLAGEQPPDIARFLLSRGTLAAKISPDGEHVALLLDTTGLRQIWIMPATGEAPKQITYGNGVTFFEWTPDGRALLYGADNDGDEQEAYYLISVDGKSERLILPAAEGGFRQFGAFSPDGARFVYASTERNGEDYDIYVADLESGESRMIVEGRYHFAAEAWIPGGDTLMVTETVGEDGNNLYILDAQTGALTPLFKPDSPANFTSGFDAGGAFAPSPDGTRVYFSTNYGREFLALGYYDFEEGAFTLIAEENGADIESPVLCGGRYLLWRVNRDGFDELKARDLRRGRDITTPPLPEGVQSVSCAHEAPQALIKVSAFDTPGDVYIWNIGSPEAERIFSSTLAGLKASDFVKPVSLRMLARDGVMLHGLLYMPKNLDAGEKPPVLFDVHGGPTGQSKAGFNPVVQYHVARGVAVFEPNVRGSTGFGRTYLSLDNREKRLDSVRDLVDMLAWLNEDGRVDTRRAAVKGGSYGGYMVNAVLSTYPDAFDAGVSLFGVGDWVTALEIASPALRASDRVEYGDIADPKWRAFYEEISPIRNADRIRVPVLYSHGARDPRIDKAETEIMVRALRRNGVEAVYILIPDEGHGWRKLANKLFYYRREAAFLESVFVE